MAMFSSQQYSSLGLPALSINFVNACLNQNSYPRRHKVASMSQALQGSTWKPSLRQAMPRLCGNFGFFLQGDGYMKCSASVIYPLGQTPPNQYSNMLMSQAAGKEPGARMPLRTGNGKQVSEAFFIGSLEREETSGVVQQAVKSSPLVAKSYLQLLVSFIWKSLLCTCSISGVSHFLLSLPSLLKNCLAVQFWLSRSSTQILASSAVPSGRMLYAPVVEQQQPASASFTHSRLNSTIETMATFIQLYQDNPLWIPLLLIGSGWVLFVGPRFIISLYNQF